MNYIFEQKPDLDDLYHHGVKGMKWGVRNEDSSSGISSVQKALKSIPKPNLSPKQKSTLAANEKKFKAKFEKSEAEPEGEKGWRPTKKQVAIAAVGAVAVGAIIYKAKSGSTEPFSKEQYSKLVKEVKVPNEIAALSGQRIPADGSYESLSHSSKLRVWTGSHVTKESFAQGEMSFPKGHEFYRLSNSKEATWGKATYMVNSKEDLARYASVTEFKYKGNLIRATATDQVRVPDLHTRLEAMREVISEGGTRKVTPRQVMSSYTSRTGGSWSDSTAQRFFQILSEKGYHAIIDDMDAGVIGETPMVLFNPSNVTSKVASSIQASDQATFANLLTEITNRR